MSDLSIVGRSESGLDDPKGELHRMRLPVAECWLHHTVTNPTDDPYADWRQVQNIHFKNGWKDIGYSYGIHPRGTVMEGRGDFIGAHTEGRNSKSLGVALIGNYEQRVPLPEQIVAYRMLVYWLEETGRLVIPPLYPTGGHRDAPGAATVCPGKFAHNVLGEFRVPWQQTKPPTPGQPVPVTAQVNRPIVATVADPKGRGYWQMTDDGGVFSFAREGQNLPFFGSLGSTRLNAPIVDAAVRPQGDGYWLVAEDGGVFSFGAAPFRGSRGGEEENAITVAIESAPDGEGYWLTTSDGGLFGFGSAFFAGRAEFRG